MSRMRSKPVIALAGCLGLAAVSLLLPSVPTTDPWGWIIWGREVAHLNLHTAIGGAPSWKPLPVLFTAPLSLFGDAAPDFWLVVARAAGLAALLLAYSLAARAAGRVAGVAAVVFVLLTDGWIRAMAHGYSEPMLDALALGAVERHLAGSRRTAFVLLALGSLSRPEVFLFAAAYGLWLVHRDRRALVAVGPALLAVPALWLGGDWWGSGNPLHGGELAKLYSNLSTGEVLNGIPTVMSWPTLVLAGISLVFAARRRERLTLALGAWAVAWLALVVLVPAFGGPGSVRFLMPPAVLVSVVAGVAVGRVAEMSVPALPRAAAAVACLGLLVVLPQVVDGRAKAVNHSLSALEPRADVQESLGRVAFSVADKRMALCGPIDIPSKLGGNRGAVTWAFRTTLDRVQARRSGYELSRSTVRFESPTGEPGLPARPSAGPIPKIPFREMEMGLPPQGAVFFMPVRHARVSVESVGFRLLYTVRDRNWTAAAVCPRKAQAATHGSGRGRPRPALLSPRRRVG